ncbi:MAG: hypothetical protein JSW55_03780 [Chloroflexota bacterium]|nr:MAG: hypothetical protein JSW55_03780 [Chloroflexota bacterium]
MKGMLAHFPNGNQARMARAGDLAQLDQVVSELGLPTPAPVLVLIGGAGLMDDEDARIGEKALETIAEAIEEENGLIVDGGTDSGIMALIGRIRQRRGFGFPLVGVTVENKVSWPGDSRGGERHRLEFHHSHFILTPGTLFGDESSYIDRLASLASGRQPSLTVLYNGGPIAREEVGISLAAERPVLVLAGTGRLADELAAKPPDSELVTAVRVADYDRLKLTIRTMISRR